jgi:hypothetical protein
MIRRTAAKAILIMAGILFLAHAVVPHHHHGNLICFVKSHCDNDGTGVTMVTLLTITIMTVKTVPVIAF